MQGSDFLSWVLSQHCLLIKSLQPSVHPSEVCTHEKTRKLLNSFSQNFILGRFGKKKLSSHFNFSSYRTILMTTLDKDYMHFCSLKRWHPCFTSMRISHHTRLQRCCSHTENVQNVSTSRLYGCSLSSIRF